jgi:protoporphyrinogen oxidase
MSKPSIGIIGGGLTGLTAAYRLVQSGVDVTILEASDRLGGLAAGFKLADCQVEQAYHFLYKTDEYILALVDELGLGDKLHYHLSTVSTYYDGILYPMMTPVDLIRFKPIGFLDRIRAGVTVLWLQRRKDWRKLSNITALEWLRKWAGRRVSDVIWEPLLRGKFDRYYDKVTMSWLWGRIVQRVDSRDPKLGGEALGYFDGGFKILVDALEKPVRKAGADVRFNAPVSKIEFDPATNKVNVTTNGDLLAFDRVLATTPSNVLGKLIAEYEEQDPEYFRKIESIDYLDAVIQVFATPQKFTPYYWHNNNSPNAPFVVFLSLTNLVGTENYNNLNIYYIGDYVPREHKYMSMDQDELKKHWYGELKKIFPEFDPSLVVDDALFRLRNAQHIVNIGFEENSLVPHQTPCPGVLMCNFSQIYPMDRGTNYAVRDGNRMAERLLASLGKNEDAANIRALCPNAFELRDNAVSVEENAAA